MNDLWADLRYGARMLFRTPVLSLVSILTIGLGVGLTTHTFSVVYGSVIRGIDVRDHDRFVMLAGTMPEQGVEAMSMSMHDFDDFRRQVTSFEALAGVSQGTVNVAGNEGPPERFDGGFVTANGLEVLGIPPRLGRTFRPGEDEPAAAGTVVLGYDVWRTRFASDESVIGRALRVNGESMTVIGVMPPGFRFPFDQEIWLPISSDWAAAERGQTQYVSVYGYLREGVTMAAATEEAQAIAARIAAEFPATNEGISAAVVRFEDGVMPPEITAVMYLMLGAVFGVLLIACANVANLLLARATLRAREVAIRTAMGADRWRVVRQLLAETVVLGILGGLLGLVFAYAGLELFNAAVIDIQKPYWIDMRIDAPALLFTLAITFVAAIAAGTFPALRASGGDMGNLLRDESRGSSSLRLSRMSGALVVVELALSCALLVGAGLMIKSVVNTQRLDIGFDPDNVMTARVGLFETDYPTREARQRFFRELHDRLNEEPGIVAASLASGLPSAGTGRFVLAIEGESYETDADYPAAAYTQVAAGFFETMGVEVVAGRDFRAGESFWSPQSDAEIEPVAIVNQSFARRFFGERDPLGRRLRLGGSESDAPWMRVVGVVPDLYVGGGVGGIGNDQVPPEAFYAPIGQGDPRFLSLAMRTTGPPEPMGRRARELVSSIDVNLPLYWVMPMRQVLADNSWAFSLFGSLFTIFGGAALFLAAVGLYGVMSFSVAQRRREMGVRMALGAEARDILRIVFNRVFVQLAIGLAVGLGLGYALSQPLRFVMFGVETSDWSVYLAIVVTLVATGLIATFFPAQRAVRVDPLTALRPD
jgi:predicted permease